ncbi:MAG: fibronectin type III domain-containing protein, partial [Elusimicrobiota bacterium]
MKKLIVLTMVAFLSGAGVLLAAVCRTPINVKVIGVSTSAFTVEWTERTTGKGICSATYTVVAATNSGLSPIVSSATLVDASSANNKIASVTVGGLLPNTIYWAAVSSASTGPFSALPRPSSSTLSLPPDSPVFGIVWLSSAAMSWTVPSGGARGYRLQASTANFSGGIVFSSATNNGNLTSLRVLSLSPNTTYFFRVGSLNWNNLPNFAATMSTSALANLPSSVAFGGVFASSVSMSWALPVGGAKGFRIDASTVGNFSGILYSSVTASASAVSLVVQSLTPNTAYFFRAGSLNSNNRVNYASTISSLTLAAVPVSAYPAFSPVNITSITCRWATNANPLGTAYVAELSSSSQFSTLLTSSQTVLTVSTFSSLSASSTYYFRVKARNQNGRDTAYLILGSTSTLDYPLAQAPSNPQAQALSSSEIVLSWDENGNAPSTPYEITLSTDNFAGQISTPVPFSSNYTTTRSTIALLSPNTIYSLRVRAGNPAGVPSPYSSTVSTKTFLAPAPATPTLTTVIEVASAAFTVTWKEKNTGSVTYILSASTNSSDLLSSMISSTTLTDPSSGIDSIATATVSGLTPNTLYYASVRATKPNAQESPFSAEKSSVTLTNPPTPAFSNVGITSMTMSWPIPDGGASNFLVQLSTDSSLNPLLISSTLAGSQTALALTGLNSQTAHYARVASKNQGGNPSWSQIISTSTLDYPLAQAPSNPQA